MDLSLGNNTEIQAMFIEMKQVANEVREYFSLGGSQNNDRLLSHREISEFLNVSEQTVTRWRDKGEIPYHPIGNNFRYSKTEVLEATRVNKKNKGGKHHA